MILNYRMSMVRVQKEKSGLSSVQKVDYVEYTGKELPE